MLEYGSIARQINIDGGAPQGDFPLASALLQSIDVAPA